MKMIFIKNDWEYCPDCNGYGLHHNGNNPEPCFSCHGEGSICTNCFEPYDSEHECLNDNFA